MKLDHIKPVLMHDWADGDPYAVVGDMVDVKAYNFTTDLQFYAAVLAKAAPRGVSEIKDLKVLFASYTYEDYSGEAFVLVAINGELYETNGSHCSCNGLEGQWDPEPTTVASLRHRLKEGTLGRQDRYADELHALLDQLE